MNASWKTFAILTPRISPIIHTPSSLSSISSSSLARRCISFSTPTLSSEHNNNVFTEKIRIGTKSTKQHKNNKRSKNPRRRPLSYKFIDRITIHVTAGDGGKGGMSFYKLRSTKRPDGGHGGNGGDVLLMTDESVQSLPRWKRHFRAEAGGDGGRNARNGRNGKDLVIKVPPGVMVKEIEETTQGVDVDDVMGAYAAGYQDGAWDGSVPLFGHEEDDIDDDNDDDDDEYHDYHDDDDDDDDDDENYTNDILQKNASFSQSRPHKILGDLDTPNSILLLSSGGKGGTGNIALASLHRRANHTHLLRPATPGRTVKIELELKMIADVGLLGFPNAGKSTLLSRLSAAKPKIAPYPFTTLNPILGVVEFRDSMRLRVADLPGLLEGASEGRGRGVGFLRHVERTKVLIYVLDVASGDVPRELRVLFNELKNYGDGSMTKRRSLVAVNKMDLVREEDRDLVIREIETVVRDLGIDVARDDEMGWNGVIGISAGVTGDGLMDLTKNMRRLVEDHDSFIEI